MVFDPSDLCIDDSQFDEQDWTTSEFSHVMGIEKLPSNMLQPQGFAFTMVAKVDADHVLDIITRQSCTGFIVYLNSAPIYWFSKKQTSTESSSFGLEFVAMKQCCKYLHSLCYKFCMIGILINGPVHLFGDNQSVLANTTIPNSTLKKKSQSIAYPFVHEGAAWGKWHTAYVNTNKNESDLLTKILPNGEKCQGFV